MPEENPWRKARSAREGRPNRETAPERAYRLACERHQIVFEEQPKDLARFSRFRPDFYHPQWKLIVEVDGPTHYTAQGRRKDARRDAALRKAGHHILHIDWLEVLHNPDAALEKAILYGFESRNTPC